MEDRLTKMTKTAACPPAQLDEMVRLIESGRGPLDTQPALPASATGVGGPEAAAPAQRP